MAATQHIYQKPTPAPTLHRPLEAYMAHLEYIQNANMALAMWIHRQRYEAVVGIGRGGLLPEITTPTTASARAECQRCGCGRATGSRESGDGAGGAEVGGAEVGGAEIWKIAEGYVAMDTPGDRECVRSSGMYADECADNRTSPPRRLEAGEWNDRRLCRCVENERQIMGMTVNVDIFTPRRVGAKPTR